MAKKFEVTSRAQAERIIRKWMAGSPFSVRSMPDYMAQTAERALIFNGEVVPTDDLIAFVEAVRQLGIEATIVELHDLDEEVEAE